MICVSLSTAPYLQNHARGGRGIFKEIAEGLENLRTEVTEKDVIVNVILKSELMELGRWLSG